ncbi:hypothetical protein L1887_58878 [Cichorium endivia]|nr:hypothetical protein L1887_58878 [Cichorium endivia]
MEDRRKATVDRARAFSSRSDFGPPHHQPPSRAAPTLCSTTTTTTFIIHNHAASKSWSFGTSQSFTKGRAVTFSADPAVALHLEFRFRFFSLLSLRLNLGSLANGSWASDWACAFARGDLALVPRHLSNAQHRGTRQNRRSRQGQSARGVYEGYAGYAHVRIQPCRDPDEVNTDGIERRLCSAPVGRTRGTAAQTQPPPPARREQGPGLKNVHPHRTCPRNQHNHSISFSDGQGWQTDRD